VSETFVGKWNKKKKKEKKNRAFAVTTTSVSLSLGGQLCWAILAACHISSCCLLVKLHWQIKID